MREGEGNTGKTRRRLAFAAVFAFVAIAFLIDLNLTQNAAPEYTGNPCASLDDDSVNELECQSEYEATSAERQERIDQLGDDIDDRSWIYLIALTVGLLGVAAGSVRAGQDVRDIAADLGVIGVLILLLGVVVSEETKTGWEGVRLPPVGRLALVSLALMIAAAIGAAYGRISAGPRLPASADPGSPPPGIAHPDSLRPPRTPLSIIDRAGLGLTLLCVLLAATQFVDPPGCDNDAAAWREVVVSIVGGAAIGAAVLGIVALFGRRWFITLVCITVPAVAFFFAAILNACIS